MENSGETVNIAGMVTMLAVMAAFLLAYLLLYKSLKRYTQKTVGLWDDFVLDLFKIPLLWVVVWLMLKLFADVFLKELGFYGYLVHFNNIVLILSVGWMLTKFVKLGNYFLYKKLDISASDNLEARKKLTQLTVFQNIANTLIAIVCVSIILMTFDGAKDIGKSLLTSAGVMGIIVGFAAQKSIAMFLAGVQIAITQPIRLDDVVVVEGEWGRIEEITLTYVVVKIWDERRLMLPVNYFLEKPFQNWTRASASILGTVFIYAGFDLPVEAVRGFVSSVVKDNPNWDNRVVNIQVTNATERTKELRVLVSSGDSSKNWDLRVEVREKVIDFIQKNYPRCFAKVRLDPDFAGGTMPKA